MAWQETRKERSEKFSKWLNHYWSFLCCFYCPWVMGSVWSCSTTFTPSSLWLLSLLLPVQLPFYFLFFLLLPPWVIWSQNYVIFICIHPTLILDTCWFRHHIGVCIEQSKCMCARTHVCAQVHACPPHTFLPTSILHEALCLGSLQVSFHALGFGVHQNRLFAGAKLQTQNIWS